MKTINITIFKDNLSIRLYDEEKKVNIAKIDKDVLIDFLQDRINKNKYELKRLGQDKLETIILK